MSEETPARQLCRRYLDALNRSDLDAVLALFTADARVRSPLYGERDAHGFYTDLFADSAQSETRLLHVFESTEGDPAIALHFAYAWTLLSGVVVRFECADIFPLSPDGSHFAGLTILYDTAPIRGAFVLSRSHAGRS